MIFESTLAFLSAFAAVIIPLTSVLVIKKARIAAICVLSAAVFSLLWQVYVFGTTELPGELFENSTGIIAEVTDYSGISKNGNSTVIKARINCAGENINAIIYATGEVSSLAP